MAKRQARKTAACRPWLETEIVLVKPRDGRTCNDSSPTSRVARELARKEP